ncbi:MAG: hypothetical protein H7293_07285 [Candidatus Saccharibacteria bacterium]|nr:hypothetical protein [Rhodoferax sp.]
MSNFYDPWQHAIQLFFTRVLQFVGLSVLLGLFAWAVLLHWYFTASWADLVRWSWDVARSGDRHWHGVFALCMVIASILVGWLFTTIILLSRLQSGERHHRGPRVVKHAGK